MVRHIGRRATTAARKGAPFRYLITPFVSLGYDFRRYPGLRSGLYAQVMTGPRGLPAEQAAPQSPAAPVKPAQLRAVGALSGRDRVLDAAGCALGAALGALFLVPTLKGSSAPLSTTQLIIDVACGSLGCLVLWWRRRWPLGVALACAALGAFSISATPAALLALFSLAVHRDG